MADNFTELKKTLSGATGNLLVDGTYLSYRFASNPPGGVIIAADSFSIAEAKNGTAKSNLIKQANNVIRTNNNVNKELNAQIAEEQKIINDPTSTPRAIENAKRRIADAPKNERVVVSDQPFVAASLNP